MNTLSLWDRMHVEVQGVLCDVPLRYRRPLEAGLVREQWAGTMHDLRQIACGDRKVHRIGDKAREAIRAAILIRDDAIRRNLYNITETVRKRDARIMNVWAEICPENVARFEALIYSHRHRREALVSTYMGMEMFWWGDRFDGVAHLCDSVILPQFEWLEDRPEQSEAL